MNVGPGTLQPRAWHSHTHWGPSLPPLVLRLLGGVTPFFLLESGQQWDELGEWISPPLGS